MMRLILINGYPFPYPENLSEAEQDALSASAPGIRLELTGVVHFEWLHTLTIEFDTLESLNTAKRLTGWLPWGCGLILEAAISAEAGYAHPAIIADNTAYCGFYLEA